MGRKRVQDHMPELEKMIADESKRIEEKEFLNKVPKNIVTNAPSSWH